MITLATLSQATAQEVLDQVTTHLLTQMKKSRIEAAQGKPCAYRSIDIDTGNILKCAAGCLIGDDELDYIPNTKSWEFLNNENKVPSIHGYLIQKLQNIHDCSDTNEWRGKLQNLALDNNLTFNPPTDN